MKEVKQMHMLSEVQQMLAETVLRNVEQEIREIFKFYNAQNEFREFELEIDIYDNYRLIWEVVKLNSNQRFSGVFSIKLKDKLEIRFSNLTDIRPISTDTTHNKLGIFIVEHIDKYLKE